MVGHPHQKMNEFSEEDIGLSVMHQILFKGIVLPYILILFDVDQVYLFLRIGS